MLLSVCIVVRDGAYYLARALNSVKHIADEIIVIDLGSYDGTIEIARDYGADVYSFQWNYDYSQARNFALKKARGKWVLFLEAYEELGDDYEQLRPLLQHAENPGFYLPVIKLDFTEEIYLPRLVLRLFKHKQGIYFQGRINEEISRTILKKDQNAKIKVLQLPVLHYTRNKLCRETEDFRPLDLYFLDVSEDINVESPAHRCLKQGIDFFWEGKLNFALNELEKGLKEAASLAKISYLKNIVLISLELEQYRRAEEMIDRGLCNYPDQVIFNFWKGYLSYKNKDYQLGLRHLHKVLLNIATPKVKKNTYLMLGLIYQKLARKEEARFYLEKAYCQLFDNSLVLAKLIPTLPMTSELEILDYLFYNCGINKKKLAFYLVKSYYQLKDYKKANNLLDDLNQEQEVNDDYRYWQGKLLLHLGAYKESMKHLKKVSPGYSRFKEVLDLLWINNISTSSWVESKSIINQIKLMGDKLSWNIIRLFNQIYFYSQDAWVEFNNLVAKLRFYRRALYYLQLLARYTNDKSINIMIEIINNLNINSTAGDLGRIFFQEQHWNKAYYYLKKSITEGESLDELILLTKVCTKLDKNTEIKKIKQKIARLENKPQLE